MNARTVNRRRRIVNNVMGVTCLSAVFAFPFALAWSGSAPVPSFTSHPPVNTPVESATPERFHMETPLSIPSMPPCEEEDSLGCVWDAQVRGNGLGTSFYATADGETIYLDHECVDEDDTYCLWLDGEARIWILDPLDGGA